MVRNRFFLFLGGWAFSLASFAGNKTLMLIGGGPLPKDAVGHFVDSSGGTSANILCITWGSEIPNENFEFVRAELASFEPSHIEHAVQVTIPDFEKAFLGQLAKATGVFFAGGKQTKILEVIDKFSFREALRTAYDKGVAFGGTSAGTAVLSGIMITGEGDFTVINGKSVEVANGLDLLPGVIFDQHFIKRSRHNRLYGLVLSHPKFLGVGIDEGTALAVKDGRFIRVFGPSQILVVGFAGEEKLLIELVKASEMFDLTTRSKVSLSFWSQKERVMLVVNSIGTTK